MSPPRFSLTAFPKESFFHLACRQSYVKAAALSQPFQNSLTFYPSPFDVNCPQESLFFVQDAFLYYFFCLRTYGWRCFRGQKSSACWQEGS
jgi:hypothetical protein